MTCAYARGSDICWPVSVSVSDSGSDSVSVSASASASVSVSASDSVSASVSDSVSVSASPRSDRPSPYASARSSSQTCRTLAKLGERLRAGSRCGAMVCAASSFRRPVRKYPASDSTRAKASAVPPAI